MVLLAVSLSGLILPLSWSLCGYEKLPNHSVVTVTGAYTGIKKTNPLS